MFTSTLTVNEFALGGLIGAQPITQVMGSSFQQVGYTGLYGGGWSLGNALITEVRPVSQAYNDARALAIQRLHEEAHRVGADAVVAVRIKRSRPDWSGGAGEFTALGTAVRLPDHHGGLAVTNLSGQDHYLLVRAGWRPLGLVAATSVFYVQPSWRTQRLTSGWRQWQNAELPDFTRGVYDARERALARITDQAERMRASGVVGVTVDQEQSVREVGENRKDLIVTFHVTGTAIADGGGGVAPHPVMRRNQREL